MKSNKAKAKRFAARVGGTVFEQIGTSKAWNPVQFRAFKNRGSGKVGEAASEVRSVEVTSEMQELYAKRP
jgi:hypothetical protein